MKSASKKTNTPDIKRLNRIAKRNSTKDAYKGHKVSNTSAIKRTSREY